LKTEQYLTFFFSFNSRIAKEFGFELIERTPFHEFYSQEMKHQENKQLFRKMKCVDANGEMTDEQWEAVGWIFFIKKSFFFFPKKC